MEENKKANYRITFHDGPMSDRSKTVDVVAKDSDEAFDLAYKMPEARRRLYDNISIEEIPTGSSVIGVKFEYYDTSLGKYFTDQVFIKAENEQQAIDYYNKHYIRHPPAVKPPPWRRSLPRPPRRRRRKGESKEPQVPWRGSRGQRPRRKPVR